jgi:hypothetical protein
VITAPPPAVAKASKLKVIPGGFTRAGAPGADSFHFTARLAGRRLPPGSYLLVAVPIDVGHRKTTTVSAPFSIIR